MSRTCLILTAAFLADAPARAALAKSCARCHAGGEAEGGFGFVLDAKQLVQRKKVVPGDAAKSRLFKRVQAG